MVVALATETQEHPRRWSQDGELDVIAIAGWIAFVIGWEYAL